MKLRDNAHMKNFLMGSTRIPGKPYVLDWQDPTYIGFFIEFNFIDTTIIMSQDYDNIGNPLLMNPDEPGSAIRYLKNINEPIRAEALTLFRESLLQLTQNAPWHFQTISGVDKLLIIDPSKNMRCNDETIITIECLEGLDMKITSLIDLYKKAVWDSVYHRWMLPENMRYFKCTITLCDYREFHRPKTSEIKFKKRKENTDKSPNIADQAKESAKESFSAKIENMISRALADSETIGDDTWKPVLSFECDLCEFNLLNSAFPFTSSINMSESPELAKQQISFKVGRVREKNSYDILGFSLYDDKMRETLTNDNNLIKEEASTDIATQLSKKLKQKAETLEKRIMLGNVYAPIRLGDVEGSLKELANKTIHKLRFGSKSQIDEKVSFKIPDTKNILVDKSEPLEETITHNYGPPIESSYVNKYEAKLESKRQQIQGKNIMFTDLRPHVPNISTNILSDEEETSTKNIGETNIGFDEPNTKNKNLGKEELKSPIPTKHNLGNIEFSGPPSI